jgi:CheY-like chemotaxis protein
VLAKARIMVVEDEALIVLDLQNMLKNLGYDVSDPARSGAEALALALSSHPPLEYHLGTQRAGFRTLVTHTN